MADTKISALTASTTPLAGTEVLPIVQGGVTKQVSVANLTAGRALSATELTLTTGNLVIGTAGKGIDFSADPSAAGMTSELLDDYEEGTWTPADASGAGLTIAITAGTTPTYVKIGRLVVCSADVTYPVTASATTARLSLPFAALATNPSGCGVVGFKSDGIAVFGSTGATGSTFLSPVNTFLTNANLSGVRFNMTWTFQV
jgi:hypothetical protein